MCRHANILQELSEIYLGTCQVNVSSTQVTQQTDHIKPNLHLERSLKEFRNQETLQFSRCKL